jgi:hypothetical protein
MLVRSSTTLLFSSFHFSFANWIFLDGSSVTIHCNFPTNPYLRNFAPLSLRIESHLHPNSPSSTTALHLPRATTSQWLRSVTTRSKSSHLLHVFILTRPVPSRAISSPSLSDQSFGRSLPIENTLSKYHSSLHV